MRKNIKTIFVLSLVINIISVSVGTLFFLKLGGVAYVSAKISAPEGGYQNNPYYADRLDLFNSLDKPSKSAVFIGDSITERALLDELFPSYNTTNRGINSDTTEGVKNRLTDIINAKPKQVFIMIGINDIYTQVATDEIIKNYRGILNQLKTGIPQTEVFVQSILPINNSIFFDGDAIENKKVKTVNEQLKRLAEEFGYGYIDIYDKVSKDDQLQESYSNDGIHPNGKGYIVWMNLIKNYLKQ